MRAMASDLNRWPTPSAKRDVRPSMTMCRSLFLQFRLLLLSVSVIAALSAQLTYAHSFEETGALGDQLQVKVLPKYSRGNLIGLEIYEVWIDGNVGSAFIAHRAYYRLDTKRVTEDREWHRLTGYLGEAVLEVENEYESQNWSITLELMSRFDRATRLVADKNTTVEEIRKIYSAFRVSPFNIKEGEKDRHGERRLKWHAGLQRIGQVEIMLSKSPKYGNHFSARFAN